MYNLMEKSSPAAAYLCLDLWCLLAADAAGLPAFYFVSYVPILWLYMVVTQNQVNVLETCTCPLLFVDARVVLCVDSGVDNKTQNFQAVLSVLLAFSFLRAFFLVASSSLIAFFMFP